MPKNKSKKSPTLKKKKQKTIHNLFNLPNKYLSGNPKAKEYNKEVERMMGSLWFTNHKVQHTAQICAFDIRSITTKRGFDPNPSEVFRMVEEFVYHYENYCYRVFAFREKLFKFLNEILSLEFTEYDVSVKRLLGDRDIRKSKILTDLEKFKENKKLGGIIKDRNALTHKLYYGKEFDEYYCPIKKPSNKLDREWFDKWKKLIAQRAKKANDAFRVIEELSDNIAKKICKFKDKK